MNGRKIEDIKSLNVEECFRLYAGYSNDTFLEQYKKNQEELLNDKFYYESQLHEVKKKIEKDRKESLKELEKLQKNNSDEDRALVQGLFLLGMLLSDDNESKNTSSKKNRIENNIEEIGKRLIKCQNEINTYFEKKDEKLNQIIQLLISWMDIPSPEDNNDDYCFKYLPSFIEIMQDETCKSKMKHRLHYEQCLLALELLQCILLFSDEDKEVRHAARNKYCLLTLKKPYPGSYEEWKAEFLTIDKLYDQEKSIPLEYRGITQDKLGVLNHFLAFCKSQKSLVLSPFELVNQWVSIYKEQNNNANPFAILDKRRPTGGIYKIFSNPKKPGECIRWFLDYLRNNDFNSYPVELRQIITNQYPKYNPNNINNNNRTVVKFGLV